MQEVSISTYFIGKVPYGDNKELIYKALEELDCLNKPLDQINLKLLTIKIIEIVNKPIKKALEQQYLDHKNGYIY